MKTYKTKNDIPYLKLLQFHKEVQGNETNIDFISQKVEELFDTTDLQAFEKALLTNPKEIKFKYKVKIDLTKVSTFVDADNFQKANNLEPLLRLFVKPNKKGKEVNANKISYAEAEFIIQSFLLAR